RSRNSTCWSTCCATWAGSLPGASSSTGCGARTTSATPRLSTSTSSGYVPRLSRIPPRPGTCSPSPVSRTSTTPEPNPGVAWHIVRLGVLDVGSNTVHLLVVDAHHGAPPLPQTSEKSVLRLAEQMDGHGKITREGADHLVRTVREAVASASASGCEDLIAFATSAVRDAS